MEQLCVTTLRAKQEVFLSSTPRHLPLLVQKTVLENGNDEIVYAFRYRCFAFDELLGHVVEHVTREPDKIGHCQAGAVAIPPQQLLVSSCEFSKGKEIAMTHQPDELSQDKPPIQCPSRLLEVDTDALPPPSAVP
jgi:hypothetical protein